MTHRTIGITKLVIYTLFITSLSLNKVLAAESILSYDVLSKEVIQSIGNESFPTSEKLDNFLLAHQIFAAINKNKLKLDETVAITPDLLAGDRKKREIILQVGKNISVKELLAALILLQSEEASEIAKRLLSKVTPYEQNLSDSKDWKIKNVAEDIAYVIKEYPKKVGSLVAPNVEIQGNSFPSQIRVSHSDISDLLFILDRRSNAALGIAFVSGTDRNQNRRIVLSLVKDEKADNLLPEIVQSLVSSVNDYETAKVFSAGKPVISIPIVDGTEKNVALVTRDDVFITLSKEELKKNRNSKIETVIERKELIKAPISRNEILARANINLGTRTLKSVPLYPITEVGEKKGTLSGIYKSFRYLID